MSNVVNLREWKRENRPEPVPGAKLTIATWRGFLILATEDGRKSVSEIPASIENTGPWGGDAA